MSQRNDPPFGSTADAAGTGAARSIAVAIRRETAGPDGEALERPRVIAKGEGALAEQILAIAFDRDIKVRSDADLAEILSAVEVDSEIPLEALAAVAEILSYVYRATQPAAQTTGGAPAGSAAAGGTHPRGAGFWEDPT